MLRKMLPKHVVQYKHVIYKVTSQSEGNTHFNEYKAWLVSQDHIGLDPF